MKTENKTYEEIYQEYLECIKFLDDSSRSKILKRNIRCRMFGLNLIKSPSEIIKEVIDNDNKL